MGANVRNIRIDVNVVLVTETCCSCHVSFAMPSELKDRRLRDRKSFYCPNGHSQAYVGKSDEEKLRQQLEVARDRINFETRRANQNHNEAIRYKRSAASLKGHLGKTKRDIACGKCPCCRRTFVNLAKHMTGQHPAYVVEQRQ